MVSSSVDWATCSSPLGEGNPPHERRGVGPPQAATVTNAIRQVQSRDPRPDARRRRALVKVARVTRPTGGVRPTD